MKKLFTIYLMGLLATASAQDYDASKISAELSKNAIAVIRNEEMVRRFVTPTRILWKNGDVKNEDKLLKQGNGQAEISSDIICSMENKGASQSAILLDFGKEIHGGLQLITGIYKGNK
ncbi:MAG: alpha-L-rhamnosidase, partial [Pedobacter sp.]